MSFKEYDEWSSDKGKGIKDASKVIPYCNNCGNTECTRLYTGKVMFNWVGNWFSNKGKY